MYRLKFLFLVLIMLSLSCARIVMPPGGTIDKTPPLPKSCSPENLNKQFTSEKITINFDEYIILKNFDQEFVSSPLLLQKPKKILKGKSLILKLNNDSLKPNTTYTLNFGNSIVDYRVGNILKQYEYVFSTGDVIDSLHICGHLYWAEDLSPQDDIWILLYENYNDSCLKTQKPDFIAKTNSEGYFSINHIAAGRYGIAALKDINNNYIFDLPNEQIAFLDTTFLLSTDKITNNDSISLNDSLISSPSFRVSPDSIDLFLFEEAFSNQYLSDYYRENRYCLSLIFNEKYDTTLNIRFENKNKQWILEPSAHKDTFNIWLTDTILANQDSLKLFLNSFKSNTSQELEENIDTLLFIYKPKKKKTLKHSLTIKSNFIAKGSFDFYKTPYIISSFPVDSLDISKLKLYRKEDTTFVPIQPLLIVKDSLNVRRYNIENTLDEDTEYKITILPNTFVDYRNWGNDSIESLFKTTSEKNYTKILLSVKGVKQEQIIIQLLSLSDKLIDERIITTDSILKFNYLKPVSYKIKMIIDDNRNNKWDSGDYKTKHQAERVKFYQESILTKANWEHEIIWDLQE